MEVRGPYFFIASKLIISVKPLCKNARHCASCLRSISSSDTFTTPFRVCLVRLASRISSDAPFYVVLPLRLRGHIVFGIYGGGIFRLLFELSRSSLGFYAPGLLHGAPLSLSFFILCPFTFRPCAARSLRLPLARYIGSDPISSGGVPFYRRDRKRYYREVFLLLCVYDCTLLITIR